MSNKDDCISRQTAIETAIEAADKWDGGYSSEREGIIRKFFDKVPAVQPATNCSEIPNGSDDTISRRAAIDALADMHCKSDEDGYVWIIRSDAWARIDVLPSVTPEQEHGKWEEKAVSDEKVIDEWQSARCSACGKYHTAPYMYYFNNYNYCPNCGARMTEEDV